MSLTIKQLKEEIELLKEELQEEREKAKEQKEKLMCKLLFGSFLLLLIVITSSILVLTTVNSELMETFWIAFGVIGYVLIIIDSIGFAHLFIFYEYWGIDEFDKALSSIHFAVLIGILITMGIFLMSWVLSGVM